MALGFQSLGFQGSGFQNNALPEETAEFDGGYAPNKKRDREAEQFQRKEDQWKADLRAAIDRAFDPPLPEPPIDRPEDKLSAPALSMPEWVTINPDMLDRSMAEIEAAFDAYEKAYKLRKHNEVAIMLLLLQ